MEIRAQFGYWRNRTITGGFSDQRELVRRKRAGAGKLIEPEEILSAMAIYRQLTGKSVNQ